MTDDGWSDQANAPEQGRCESCGKMLPRTKRRSKAFGGRGRARRYCDSTCRSRELRRRRASTS